MMPKVYNNDTLQYHVILTGIVGDKERALDAFQWLMARQAEKYFDFRVHGYHRHNYEKRFGMSAGDQIYWFSNEAVAIEFKLIFQ